MAKIFEMAGKIQNDANQALYSNCPNGFHVASATVHLIRTGRRPVLLSLFCLSLCPIWGKEGCCVWETVDISVHQSL